MARTPKTQLEITRLLQKKHLLSPLQILSTLEKQNPSLNKTTVYRALDKMLTDGLVCRQIFNNEQPLYELRTDNHHDHAACERCGKVTEIPCQTTNRLTIDGYTIDHHHTTFFGLCKKCSDG